MSEAPRPFTAVKAFADSVLAMLDERIEAEAKASHPFNDYFGDQPEKIVEAKAKASELKDVRWKVRELGDKALVDLMKFNQAHEAQQAQAPVWISVKDGLPAAGRVVPVTMFAGRVGNPVHPGYPGVPWIELSKLYAHEKFFDCELAQTGQVTHWLDVDPAP